MKDLRFLIQGSVGSTKLYNVISRKEYLPSDKQIALKGFAGKGRGLAWLCVGLLSSCVGLLSNCLDAVQMLI